MDNINENPIQENSIPAEEPKLSKRAAKKAAKKDKKTAKKEKKAAKKEAKKQGKKKLSKEDKKGVLLIVALAVVAIALLSVCMNAVGDKEASATTDATTTSAPTVTTAPPPATMPYTTTQPSTGEDITVTASAELNSDSPTEIEKTTASAQTTTQQITTTQKAGPTDAEILEVITKGINSLQSDTASFKGIKTQVIYVQLNDCSVPFLTSTINRVIEFFTGEEVYEYDFTNGKAMDPEEGVEVTSLHMIPPTDKLFTLTLDGVADASVTENEKGTVYSVTVVPETSTLTNPRPPHHNAAGDTLDFSAFELPVGEITKADFDYPGATVSVTIDRSGKIVEYHERLNMKGTGEGNAIGITASGEMEGYIDETWSIEWK